MLMSEAFPSKWLRAADLKGSEPVVEISHVDIEHYPDGKSGPVLYFKNKEKGLGLNKTNATNLALMFGDESDDWSGHRIQLFTIWTQDKAGKPVQGIRVRPAPSSREVVRRTVEKLSPTKTHEDEPPVEDYDAPHDEVPF